MIQTRPSGAHRWTRCAAAPAFASRVEPQPDSDPAREGTCAAWVADNVLKGEALKAADLIGTCHANGWEVDAEMAGHVQNYVDMIREAGGFISAERHVTLSPLVAGTLDNSASALDGTLYVRDLKYGFRLVEADTEQLVIYAGALLNELQGITRVVTEIYQPRGFHVDGIHRSHEWTAEEIRQRCEWIIERAEMCHAPDPVATPGKHCMNCEGAAGCEALAATSANLVVMAESAGHRHRTPQEVAQGLTFAQWAYDIIKAAKDAAESEATARLMSGEYIPGWGLKERLGHTKLTASREAVKAMTGIDPVKDAPMTPSELKAAGVTDRQMKLITMRPVIGHKLSPLNDKDLQRQFKET